VLFRIIIKGNRSKDAPQDCQISRSFTDCLRGRFRQRALQNQNSFCDLIKNPQLYSGKEVTVRATYKYGFEWQYLYCLGCIDDGKVWLEIADGLDDASVKALKQAPKGAGTIKVWF
jgi:hypothetical protein